tara:strand:+ start:31 stop:447 length:417 start_codon:yes stop_codon:yes gene_type:complete
MAFFSIKQRKRFALFILAFAIILGIPPNIPPAEIFSDVLLNIPIATFIYHNTGFSLINSLILTYTVIPILLIYLAAVIYPSDTNRVFDGFINQLKFRLKQYLQLVRKNPIYLVLTLIIFYILFYLTADFYIAKIDAIL